MENLFTSLGQYGPLALITGYVLWQSYRLQGEMLKVITDNTEALTKLTVLIDKKVEK